MQAVVMGCSGTRAAAARTENAWRPHCEVLAADSGVGANGLAPPERPQVTLYDCTKGKALATLTPPTAKSSESQGGWPVRWSPSGKQLLLYDPLLNAVVVWGPDMLPK